jgi:ribulose-5-phosphate 4-epimerase/fuculose-1-phosphate aldolase
MSRPDAPDPTAWCIHSRLHALLPQARCVLHLHPPYATAIATLAEPGIPPIDQNTARFYRRIAIDRGFSGMADSEDEGERLARAIGPHKVMMMQNHGILVTGASVAEAFEDLYYLERACRTLVLAYSTGKPLAEMTHEVAERTALDWEPFAGMACEHFAALRAALDRTDPSYAD